MTSEGIIYYGTGEQYLQEAMKSAESVKEHNNIDITIFTDEPAVQYDCFDSVRRIDPGQFPFYDRITYFKQTPYEKTIYLDTDTVTIGDITPIFDMLDRFDILASLNETRNTASESHKYDTVELDVPEAFPEYQCGVLGFRDSSVVMDVFDDWQDRYREYRDKFVLDQPFFAEALFNNSVNIGTLPSEYNALLYLGGYFEQNIRIVHLAGTRPKKSALPFINYKTVDEAIAELNKSVPTRKEPTKRVIYYDSLNRIQVRHTTESTNFIPRVIQSIVNNGLAETLRLGTAKTRKYIRKIT